VSDSAGTLDELRRQLTPRFTTSRALLGDDGGLDTDCQTIVIAARLRAVNTVTRIRKIVRSAPENQKKIFIIDRKDHLVVSQAYALGATSFLVAPIDASQLIAAIDTAIPIANSDAGSLLAVRASPRRQRPVSPRCSRKLPPGRLSTSA
jgi:DNA-binding NarL/FixJ family response regulator